METYHIQARPGRNQPNENNAVRRARTAERFPTSSHSQIPSPTRASGHQPHGGNAAATRIPAPSGASATAAAVLDGRRIKAQATGIERSGA